MSRRIAYGLAVLVLSWVGCFLLTLGLSVEIATVVSFNQRLHDAVLFASGFVAFCLACVGVVWCGSKLSEPS